MEIEASEACGGERRPKSSVVSVGALLSNTLFIVHVTCGEQQTRESAHQQETYCCRWSAQQPYGEHSTCTKPTVAAKQQQ
jgi:hypothetical protein